VNMGTADVEILEDDWTVKPLDRSLSAHYEHTILIKDKETEILTVI
jgi:methionyl aminopeptidase